MAKSVQLTLTGEETKPYTDRQRLRTLYDEEDKSVAEIASTFDCGETTIRTYLRAFGLWDGDPGSVLFYTGKRGYEHLQIDHHNIRVHRALVIAEYGLDALDGESVVHHCTEIPWDNRIEELRVFPTQSKHTSHHARPTVAADQETLDASPALTTAESNAIHSHWRQGPRQTTLFEFQEADATAHTE